MTVKTNMFGEISVDEVKKVVFTDGIIGFPELKNFTLITDEEGENSKIFWLQSLDDGTFAMPVVDPFAVFDEYNPIVEDEWFNRLGEYTEEDLIVFLSFTVPEDVTKMSVNQKAPLIINAKTNKGCQIIVDGEEYQVQYPVYDILKKKNQKAGE